MVSISLDRARLQIVDFLEQLLLMGNHDWSERVFGKEFFGPLNQLVSRTRGTRLDIHAYVMHSNQFLQLYHFRSIMQSIKTKEAIAGSFDQFLTLLFGIWDICVPIQEDIKVLHIEKNFAFLLNVQKSLADCLFCILLGGVIFNFKKSNCPAQELWGEFSTPIEVWASRRLEEVCQSYKKLRSLSVILVVRHYLSLLFHLNRYLFWNCSSLH